MKRLFTIGATLALVACGGGGGGGGGGTSTSATASVPVTVVDGAIHKATVCLDKNKNGACDSGEPFAITAVDGTASLTVNSADAGQYPIIAIIGTDAVDADNGPVTVPYVMKAPADKPGFVSPLTTMVQNVVETTGSTSTAAETLVKAQTGVNLSLFEDFTKSSTDDAKAAGTLARMVVITTQQQADAIKSAEGSTDTGGATITKADLERAVQKKLLELIPALVAKLSDPAVTGASGTVAKNAALLTSATALISSDGLSADAAKTAIAINKQVASGGSAETSGTVAASASLSKLIFNSATDWSLRAMTASVAQNTPNPSTGVLKYREIHTEKTGATAAYSWGFGKEPRRGSDLHWNGSSWTACSLNFENTSSARDANGNSTYNYCDGFETGKSNRAVFDIGGRPMLEVYNQIRAAGYANVNIPSAATVLASGTFPTGSKLFYQTGTVLSTAPGYFPGTSNYVFKPDAQLAAGSGPACSASPQPSSTADNVTLENLVATLRGTPCIFSAATVTGANSASLSSGATNESWSHSTLSLGIIGTAPTFDTAAEASAYYTTNTPLRVAFGDNKATTYYSCQQRYDSSTRNCKKVGEGSYTIQTMGDTQVMTFNGLPAVAAALDWERVLVQKGSHVYFGYKDRPLTFNSARLNLAASNALFSQLGMPTLDPEAPITLTQSSFSGTYKGTYAGTYTGTFNVTVPTTGAPSCSGTDTLSGSFICTFSMGAISSTVANINIGVTTNGANFTGTFDYTTGSVSGNWSNTGGSGTFTGSRY